MKMTKFVNKFGVTVLTACKHYLAVVGTNYALVPQLFDEATEGI
jgi:hypothetical protein